MNKTILKYALGHAVGAAVYIGLVAALMTNVEKIFGGDPGGWLGPVLFLLVFVISAAVMGLIIFARPAMWYLDGRKREALSLTFATLGTLVVIAAIVFAGLVVGRGTASTEPVACTDEAKLCPDGSAVGRTGPRCEFAPCPDVSSKEETNAAIENNTPQPEAPPQTEAACITTGCNGVVCIDESVYNKNPFATTCVYLPQYACYKNAKCERQPNGRCGWTQDAALTACLASFESR